MGPFAITHKLGILADLNHLVFPNKCLSCEQELTRKEKSICSLCEINSTETNFHLSDEPTAMDKIFWGRIAINHTYAHFFFEKDKTAQKILFQLKYADNREIGIYFGRVMARRISLHPGFEDCDAIIPIPLHPKKEFIRGYNQSEAIAQGLAEGLTKPLDFKSIRRVRHGQSQTKKSRFERWNSIQTTFSVKESIKKHTHIVLVDDVITTGSTVEVVARAIFEKHPDVKISVVTLAIT